MALAIGAPAFPQEKPAGGAVIRSTTRIVNVSLVVTDSQGNPLKNLTREELTLLDDGKPQSISFFATIDNEVPLPAPPPPGPDIFINRPAGAAATRSVTILLFDILNSRWSSQANGLKRVRKFLRQVQPQDHIGLYLLSDEMTVLHSFHDDSAALIAAVQRFEDESSKADTKPAAPTEPSTANPLDHFLSGKESRSRLALDPSCGTAGCAERRLEATQITIASLEAIARQLASVPGRKSLIWVTDRIPGEFLEDTTDAWLQQQQAGLNLPNIPPRVNYDDIERMMRLMSGSGVAVYPVSAEGLETADPDFANADGPAPITSSSAPVNDTLSHRPDASSHLYMDELASRTGGRAFINRNDIEAGLRRALDDSRFSYSLAYYPDHSKWKGEWRKIQVQVNRPGVTVLARGGYFALQDPRPLAPKNRYEFLSSIAASPLDSPQLPLAVRMATSSGPKGAQLDAQVHMNPQPILSLQNNGHWKGSFEVVFLQLDGKNKVLNVINSDIDADLDANKYAEISQRGWSLPAHLPYMHGATVLCVILRDKLSDTVGSIHIPLARYSASLAAR